MLPRVKKCNYNLLLLELLQTYTATIAQLTYNKLSRSRRTGMVQLRHGPCVTRDHTVLPATHTHEPYLVCTSQRQGITAL